MLYAVITGFILVAGLFAFCVAVRITDDSPVEFSTTAMIIMLLFLAGLNLGSAIYRVAHVFGHG
jgi:hypothetical protein